MACVVASLVAVALSLATACGGPPSAAEPLVPTPVHGGTLRMAQQAPRTLDPLQAATVYESLPANHIFDTLIDLDPSLNLAPGLADTWTVSPDGLTFALHVRPGVRFHHGETLTAADVVFSIRRHLSPDRPLESLAYPYLLAIRGARAFSRGERADVPGLVAHDDETVLILLERRSPAFLEVLALDSMAIVPERRFRELGAASFARAPSGTGPFRLDHWRSDGLRLAAFREHWAGAPLLEAVEVGFLADDEHDNGAARFLAGQIDVLEPPTDAIEALRADPEVDVRVYQELSLSFLGLNAARPPLDRDFVRQAIAMAIDRRALVDDSPALRRMAVGVLPPGMAGYSPDDKTLPIDPAGARRLLAQHGHPDGIGLPPIVLETASRNDAVSRIVARITDDLASIGLRVVVRDVTWNELGEGLQRGTTAAFLLGWVADLSHPDGFVRPLVESDGAANFFAYVDDETDELLRRGVVERNPVDFARTYRQLERRVLSRAPLVPLYHTRGVVAVRHHVVGFEPGPLGTAKVPLQRVWLRDGGAP